MRSRISVGCEFGLVLTQQSPVCEQGYNARVRAPQEVGDAPMDFNARCSAPPSVNPRGTQNAPRAAFAGERSPVIGSFNSETGELTMGDEMSDRTPKSVPVDQRSDLQSLLSWPVGQ